jgi:hypothetical protein
MDMAAAPDPFVDEPRSVSPELALVDATMAAELRGRLSSPWDAPASPRNTFSEVLATSSPPAKLVEAVFGDALADPCEQEMDEFRDERAPIAEEAMAEGVKDRSSYPALPAPQSGEQPTGATEAALLRIRERFHADQEAAADS